MTFNAKPTRITSDGAKTTLSVELADDTGAALAGEVTIAAAAGQLGAGDKTSVISLDEVGSGTETYACDIAIDSTCSGNIRLEASWQSGAKFLVQVLRVTVAPPTAIDGGSP